MVTESGALSRSNLSEITSIRLSYKKVFGGHCHLYLWLNASQVDTRTEENFDIHSFYKVIKI